MALVFVLSSVIRLVLVERLFSRVVICFFWSSRVLLVSDSFAFAVSSCELADFSRSSRALFCSRA